MVVGVLPKTRPTEELAEKKPSDNYICHCGKNDKTASSHYRVIDHKYTTLIRCECLKKSRACIESCKCKNCDNPLGRKPQVNNRKRKREKHDWQMYHHQSSVEFAKEKEEKLTFGSITAAEYFILENILTHLNDEQIEPTTENIFIAYSQILPYANDLHPTSPI